MERPPYMLSLISRVAPAEAKGSALGIFVGGALGVWLQGVWGLTGVFGLCAVLAGLWLIVSIAMRPPLAKQVKLS